MTGFRIVRIKEPGLTVNLTRPEGSGWPCPYCAQIMKSGNGSLSPTYEHVIPRSRGGSDDPANILIVCMQCNNDKADMTLFEFCGFLTGLSDERRTHIDNIVEIIGKQAEFTPEEWSSVYGEMGVGFSRSKGARLRRAVHKKKVKFLKTPEPVIDTADVATAKRNKIAIHNVMARLGIAFNYWKFDPPNGVRIVIKSRLVRFSYRSERELEDAVAFYRSNCQEVA
jgi:hypothetical protein